MRTALRVLRDLRAILVPHRRCQVLPDLLVPRVTRVLPVRIRPCRVRLDRLARKVMLGRLDPRVIPGLLARLALFPVLRDLRVLPGRKVTLAHRVLLVRLGLRLLFLVRKDLPVLPDLRVQRLRCRVLLGLRVLRVRLAPIWFWGQLAVRLLV